MAGLLTRPLYRAAANPRRRARTHFGAARVGIGGPVGSGKTALLEQIIPRLIRQGAEIGVITNDLATQEDAERVKRSGLIDPARVMAVETGPSPHAAIGEDVILNMRAVAELQTRFASLDLILIESSGDSLASTFSSNLVDYWLFVIDVAGGNDIPRKKGLGVLQVRPAGHQQSRSCPLCARGPGAPDPRSQPGPRRATGAGDQLSDG